MGCGMSTEEKEGKARNEEIENQLKRDKMMQRNEIKMLLLGTFAIQLGPSRDSVSHQMTMAAFNHGRLLTIN
jgi:hypothetical protein